MADLSRAVEAAGYADTVSGWAQDAEGADEVMAATHDLLIKRMGDRRTSEVRWLVKAGDEATEHLAALREGKAMDEASANHYRRLAGLLREYGGMIITAVAAGRPATAEEAAAILEANAQAEQQQQEAEAAAARAMHLGLDPNIDCGPVTDDGGPVGL